MPATVAAPIRPPDEEHDWLSTSQAAEVMGLGTPQAVVNRCRRSQLPFEWSSGRRWIRRDQLEMAMRVGGAEGEAGVARARVTPVS